jgi:hypothetical protein
MVGGVGGGCGNGGRVSARVHRHASERVVPSVLAPTPAVCRQVAQVDIEASQRGDRGALVQLGLCVCVLEEGQA